MRSLAEPDALAEHSAATSADTPEVMWTTVPPAKSSAPSVAQPAAHAPDPVRDRVIDERRPEQAEDHERLEALALGERAGDQRRGDDGEHHLEDHERLVRDRRRVVGVRLLADALQAEPVEPADEAAAVGAEGQAYSPRAPTAR